jgi:hypothetical protein
MSDDDLVIDREMEEEEEYESSGSGSQTKERSDVHVKTRIGTKLYREDEDCFRCDELGDGVLVIENGDSIGSGVPEIKVLCEEHRISEVREAELGFEETEWHSFEVEGDD